jgi:transcriptional regulator of acetoin/glycerol metabolism
LQIGGAGDEDWSGETHSDRNQASICKLADANGNIRAFFEQVNVAVRHCDMDRPTSLHGQTASASLPLPRTVHFSMERPGQILTELNKGALPETA